MEESNHPDSYRFPGITVLLVLGSLLAFLFPAVSDYFLYDRNLVLSGQVWRLATGLLVHFSWSHLVYNAVILVLAGWMIERKNRSILIGLVLLTAVLSSLYFILLMPGMKQYGGLSGIASAVVAYLCMVNIKANVRNRWVWITILVLLAAKIAFEIITRQSFFVAYATGEIRVVPETHVIGLVVAILLLALPSKIIRKNKDINI